MEASVICDMAILFLKKILFRKFFTFYKKSTHMILKSGVFFFLNLLIA